MQELQKTLDWDVREKQLFTTENYHVEDYKAIMRDDNKQILSVMKNSYHPLSNTEFKERVNKIAEISKFELEGFTEFKGGSKILSFLRNTRENVHIGGHKLKEYMVIGNSHDGSSSFFIGTSSLLIRCQNQFSEVSKLTKVRHTKNSHGKMQEAYDYFDYYLNKREKMLEMFNKMRNISVDSEVKDKMINFVLDVKETEEKEVSTRKKNQILSLNNFMNIETNDLGENLWGIFNGVTRYTTHGLGEKGANFGSIFGTPAKINEKAFAFCKKFDEGILI